MMHIKITPRQLSGCTDFVPQPARLHLGSQNAQGVDTLAFDLPPEWAGSRRTGVCPRPCCWTSWDRRRWTGG